MNISTVNELIQSLESAGELSIKERKYLELAKAYLQLASENVALKNPDNWLSQSDYGYEASEVAAGYGASEDEVLRAGMIAIINRIATPATDAYLAGLKADAAAPLVSALKVIANSEQHNGDTVVCDFDTLISVAACALRDYYAMQLREGADK